MRISWNLLGTLIDLQGLSPERVAEVLTSTGLEVEGVHPVEPVEGMLTGVIVGHVLECTKHPDADRLSVCMVDLGQGAPVRIVCGAPNVKTGQKVLVATVGAVLHPAAGGSLVIKKSRIRGVESEGMICAEDELGLGEGHAGILVLDDTAPIGRPAAEMLGLRSDRVLEIGLTPNRSDALGHLGVARDLAAALRIREARTLDVRMPDVNADGPQGKAFEIPVTVEAPHGAPRYAGITLADVKVGPSPAWLQETLTSLGLKPINNVVDVTNLVQHELGQPLHAFDADRLAGERIVVRMARKGERFVTLDGKERTLDAEDLVIADAEKPACLAGIFGGADSGISDGTSRVFLESACFDATLVRRAARRHGLSTDASFRFERGVDPGITTIALQRAVLLLRQVAGARVASPLTDVYPHPHPWKRIEFAFARQEALCGFVIAPAVVVAILEALGCRVIDRSATCVQVEVPPYRVDVHREADLIEEVLRIHGFDGVPVPERLMVPSVHHPDVTPEGAQRQVALHLAARGFREVMTPSLVSGARTASADAALPPALVRVHNALSAELDVLRPTMLFGLLQAAAHNIARQQRDLRLFEQGRVYAWSDGVVREEDRSALLITGARWTGGWRSPRRAAELADVREELELLGARMGLLAEPHPVEHALLADALELRRKDTVVATIGRVADRVLKLFDLNQPVFFAEWPDRPWTSAVQAHRTTYQEVPRFPAVRRDLSLLLDRNVPYAELRKLAFQAEKRLLQGMDLFDVYEGQGLPKDKKSYALSFTLRDDERTLTDDVVEKAMGRIRQALEKGVGAELRG